MASSVIATFIIWNHRKKFIEKHDNFRGFGKIKIEEINMLKGNWMK